jgi:very-short-patch-repair endonuclease
MAAIQYQAERLREDDGLSGCQSEIERAFGISLILGARIAGGVVALSREKSKLIPRSYFLEPQAKIGKYRVDFLFGFGDLADDLSKAVVIECDGHEWHERTKEQAAADKSRDRYLSGEVSRVLRFTGAEIFADPDKCAREAAKILSRVHGAAL